jgi:Spy/CpxP family protein refolding chaperone
MAALMQLDDLTTEQKAVLKDIRKATRDAMRDLRDEMEDNRIDLHDAMAENADIDTIRKLAEKQGDQVASMVVLRAEVRNKINSVLTKEQQQQLEDMRRPGREFGHGPKGF